MKIQEDKKIDEFVGKIFDEVKIESPSSGFTDRVMQQIEALEDSKIMVYQPLIPKRVWALIGFMILSAFVYLTMTTGSESGWMQQIDFSVLTNNSITRSISEIEISKTLMYTLVFMSLMICIQIPLLKSYFDKRLQY